MTRKNIKQNLTLAGLVTAAALSLTAKTDALENIPRDNAYDSIGRTVSLVANNQIKFLPYYLDLLDNNKDTADARIEDYRMLDSLITKAKGITADLQVPLIYCGTHLDSLETNLDNKLDSLVKATVNRPMINEEALVSSMLDTISSYTEVVDKYFIRASIREESMYNPKIVSLAGARGLMQFMKNTWKRFGEGSYQQNVFNPEKNIRAGIKYYTWMEEEFSKKHPNWDGLTLGEKRDLLASAYNGGHNRLMSKKVNWNIKEMPKESQDHIIKINKAMTQFSVEELYKNIAMYQARIESYESEGNKTFWFAYRPATIKELMRNYVLASSTNESESYSLQKTTS